jgi:hypothetical protein
MRSRNLVLLTCLVIAACCRAAGVGDALEAASSVIVAHWHSRARGEAAAAQALRHVRAAIERRLLLEEGMEASEQLARGVGVLTDRRVRWDGKPSARTRSVPSNRPPADVVVLATSGSDDGDAGDAIGLVVPAWGRAGVAGCLDRPWRRELATMVAGGEGIRSASLQRQAEQALEDLVSGVPVGASVLQQALKHLPPSTAMKLSARPEVVALAASSGVLSCPLVGLDGPASLVDLLESDPAHAFSVQVAKLKERAPQSQGKEAQRKATAASMALGGMVDIRSERSPVAFGQRPPGEEPSEFELRREGILGTILHGPNGTIDWALAGERAVQGLLGVPLLPVRAAWEVSWWVLGTAIPTVMDVSGLWQCFVTSPETPWDLAARAALGASARHRLWLELREHWLEAVGYEVDDWLSRDLPQLVERHVSRPVRFVWQWSGLSWVWSKGWELGDIVWRLIDRPQDLRYTRPEAVILRTATTWLDSRIAAHDSAASQATALSLLFSGAPITPTPSSIRALQSLVASDHDDQCITPEGIPEDVFERFQSLLFGPKDLPVNASVTRAMVCSQLGHRTAAQHRHLSRTLLGLVAVGVPPGHAAATLGGAGTLGSNMRLASEHWRGISTNDSLPWGTVMDWDGRGLSSSVMPGLAGQFWDGESSHSWWWWSLGVTRAVSPQLPPLAQGCVQLSHDLTTLRHDCESVAVLHRWETDPPAMVFRPTNKSEHWEASLTVEMADEPSVTLAPGFPEPPTGSVSLPLRRVT